MSKPGIETQAKKWLEGRGRWLRSGGDNLVRYWSVMLGNGDQVDDLVALLTADDLPDWLYVERDGRRVTLVGLAQWRTDQDVEYDEVSDDAWVIVAVQYAEIARLQQQVETVTTNHRELEELCSELTAPQRQAVSSVSSHGPMEQLACDHATLEQELGEARARAVALDSVNTNNRQVIAGLQGKLRAAGKEIKLVRRAAATATAEREETARALLELVYLVMNAPGANFEVEDLARRQFMKFANLFRRVLDKQETRGLREVHQQLTV